MQHGKLCRCNSGCAAATRAVQLQLWLRHCNTGCAAATRVCHCSTGNSTTARAVPLQHELNQMICFECCRKRFKATTRVRCALDRELHGITALPNQQRCSVLVQAALLQRDDARAAHPAPLHHDLRFCSPRVHDTPLYCERRQLHRRPANDALCAIAPQDAPRAARAAPREAPTRCAASDACQLNVCASAARVGCAAAT